MIHVETIEMTEALHIFQWVHTVLNVLVVTTAKHWIVDQNTMNCFVIISFDNRILQCFTIDFSQLENDSRFGAALFSNTGILFRGWIRVRQEAHQLYTAVAFLDLYR